MFDPAQNVPKEDIEKILTTAQHYPCGIGAQESDFIAITNKQLLLDLSEKLRLNIPEFTKYLTKRITDTGVKNSIWCDAPLVVILVSNEQESFLRETNMGEAAMSVIYAAEALGYSTLPVLMCANPAASKFTSEAIGVPQEKIGISIAIGKAKPEWNEHVDTKKIKPKVTYIE